MVELRKRKSTTNVDPTPAKKSSAKPKATKAKEAIVEKTKEKQEGEAATESKEKDLPSAASKGVATGDQLTIDGFGGEFGLTDGSGANKASLKAILDKSEAGVILFTYPKASTPGCTKQACLFRDNHSDLTKTGWVIYGLSRDSVKANGNFKEKQNLPYTLICDQSGDLIKALGFHKAPKSTTRGVVAIRKDGKVVAHMTGGPDATVEAVKPIVKENAEKL